MVDLGAANVPKHEDIVKQLKEIAPAVINELIIGPITSERQAQLNRAMRNELFAQGNHFIYPAWTADESQAFYQLLGNEKLEGQDGKVRFMYAPNFIRGDRLKFISVMGAGPNVKIVPNDPHNTEHVQRAKIANIALKEWFRRISKESLVSEIAENQFTSGPTFIRIHYAVDGDKYGVRQVPKVEVVEETLPSGEVVQLPQETGMETYENGFPECHVYTTEHVAIPYEAKSEDDCFYLELTTRMHRSAVLQRFGKAAKPYLQTSNMGGTTNYTASSSAIQVQEVVTSPINSTRNDRINYEVIREVWMRPSQYPLFDERANNGTEELSTAMRKLYPNGLCVSLVNEHVVEVKNQRIKDAWVIIPSGMTKYLSGHAICEDSIQLQKAINDLINLYLEIVLRNVPRSIADKTLFNWESLSNNEAMPAEIIPTMAPVQGDINQKIARMPMPEVSPQLPELYRMVRGDMQEINGIRPELTGGGPPAATFREAKQRKDQALMQHAPRLRLISRGVERLAMILLAIWAKNGDTFPIADSKAGSIFESGVTEIDVSQLSEGGFHAEADDAFPMSQADVVASLEMIMQNFPPEVQQALGLLDPVNIPMTRKLIGVDGFRSPVEDQVEYIQGVLKRLMMEDPVEEIDQMTGEIRMTPSIPIDPVVEDSNLAITIAKQLIWTRSNSPEAQGTLANVHAWMMEHKRYLEMMAQPPMPPDAPAPAGQAKPQVEELGPTTAADAEVPQEQEGMLPPLPPPGMEQVTAIQ